MQLPCSKMTTLWVVGVCGVLLIFGWALVYQPSVTKQCPGWARRKYFELVGMFSQPPNLEHREIELPEVMDKPQQPWRERRLWNQLLKTNIFRLGHFFVISSEDDGGVLKELQTVMQDVNLFRGIYNRYLAVFKKPAIRSASQTHQDVFKQNLVKIAEHNLQFRAGTKKWEKGVNQFTDTTASELERMKCYKALTASLAANYSTNTRPLELSDEVPDSFDWREEGHVTSVKDQGQCGSCYAFATTAALESCISREYQVDLDLSEQEIVDCTQGQNNGCNGGNSPQTFGYMQKVRQTTESSYPYEAVEDTCRADGKPHVARVIDFWDIEPDEETIKKAVAQYGPIPVGIHTNEDFMAYTGKDIQIFESDCDGEIDHEVLIVGYGSDEGNDYWIIKNSWGTWWGDNGFIYMARNYPNMCGIGTTESYAMAITAVYDA